MTARLGEWIVRSGDELKLQLPPVNVAPRFTRTVEIKRDGTHLVIRSVENDYLVRWEVGIDVPEQREARAMPADEFNSLLREGALQHPFPAFMLTRAHLALFFLTQTVPGATEALRRWAVDRDAQDAYAAAIDLTPNPEGRE